MLDAIDMILICASAAVILVAMTRRLLIAGIAGALQLLLTYDYRRAGMKVLNGRVREDEIANMEPMAFLERLIPIAAIPYEMIEELRRQVRKEREGFPQIVYTANLFGVLAAEAVRHGRLSPRRG